MESEVLIQKIDTNLNADAVEWCPHEGLENILLCGTYKLQDHNPQEDVSAPQETVPSKQTRVGGIIVYSLNKTENFLEEKCRLDSSGVLDIKWLSEKMDDRSIFGVVDADGFCKLLSLTDPTSIQVIAEFKLTDTSLGLSLGFSNVIESGKHLVTASDSAGFITVLDVKAELKSVESWPAHDYEAWITAIHKYDSNLIFSGGDDCRLKGWDLRDVSRPAFSSKRHQMGVCSVQSHPCDPNLFASGSYDEEVLVWDRRNMKATLANAELGGGVWRIKWKPDTGSHILTATMYNGTHIVDYTNPESGSMPIVAHHVGHNLAYGADWYRCKSEGTSCNEGGDDGSSHLIATCSFYDHSLHLWKWIDKNKN